MLIAVSGARLRQVLRVATESSIVDPMAPKDNPQRLMTKRVRSLPNVSPFSVCE